jgi:hypothetical protein
LKEKNQINKRIQNKNQKNEHQIKKKKQEYGSKDEIENKLKFDKRAKNQN